MQKTIHSSLLLLSLYFLYLIGRPSMANEVIPVGVILDLNSPLGIMANNCIRMGLQDFYQRNPLYATRVDLRIRDSGNDDIVKAAVSALKLIYEEKVHAIIGPQSSEEAMFVVELGRRAQVPIISFSAASPSLSPPRTQFFFIRTTHSDCYQFQSIAAIIDYYGWHEIIPIYEDTEYGNSLNPCLADAMEEIDTRIPYKSVIDPRSKEDEISEELHKLRDKPTKVFLVHMQANLGARFFLLAHREGMMTEGYAWIITQRLSVRLAPMGREVMASMQGVLGVRPKFNPKGKKLKDFSERWANDISTRTTDLTLFGFWAYDTVQALATAVEKAGIVNSTLEKSNFSNKSRVDIAEVGFNETGPKLANAILGTKFSGLSGNFSLIEGQLEPSELEVFNLVGAKESVIGYWSPERGLFRHGRKASSEPIAKDKLEQPTWPGNTTERPRKLRIGVPERQGFTEFGKVESRNGPISDFGVNVFTEAVQLLPFSFPYEFINLTKEDGSYDDLLCQIKEKNLDAIVGDITIVANRTSCVDFTLPYTESSVSMVVPIGRSFSTRVLLEPFDTFLWIFLGSIFVATTGAIILLEMSKHKKNGGDMKKVNELMWCPFTVYARETKDWKSNLSKWTAMICSFMFVVVIQIYTANLTSMLSEGTTREPAFRDVKEIQNGNYSVGYPKGSSMVKGFLIERLGFDESKLRDIYETPEAYDHALSNVTEEEGVAAIFDETPYIMLFLSKYGSKYDMVGPRYQTDGYGFAFPKKSILVSHFSVAILNVTEDTQKFQSMMKKYNLSSVPYEFQKSSGSRSLTVNDFGKLLPVIAYILCFLFFLLYFKYTVTILRKKFSSYLSAKLGSAFKEAAYVFLKKDREILPPRHDDTSTHEHHRDS